MGIVVKGFSFCWKNEQRKNPASAQRNQEMDDQEGFYFFPAAESLAMPMNNTPSPIKKRPRPIGLPQ